MVDFVQWGGVAPVGRLLEAIAARQWTVGDFVPAVAEGHSISYDGEGNHSSDWIEEATPTIGAENDNATRVAARSANEWPRDFMLSPGYPNPFYARAGHNGSGVRFNITLPAAGEVRVEIVNVVGQRVRLLLRDRLARGHYNVWWEGRDDFSKAAGEGVYFARMIAGKFSATQKIALVR